MVKITQEMVTSWMKKVEEWIYDDDTWTDDLFDIEVEEIASGVLGTHQPARIADKLQLDVPDDVSGADAEVYDWNEDEFAWEEILARADELADIINNMSELPGRYYFGHNDIDGSWGLRYTIDKDELEASQEDELITRGSEELESVVTEGEGWEVAGVKGMNSKRFRKTFKSEEARARWVEKNKDEIDDLKFRDPENNEAIDQVVDQLLSEAPKEPKVKSNIDLSSLAPGELELLPELLQQLEDNALISSGLEHASGAEAVATVTGLDDEEITVRIVSGRYDDDDKNIDVATIDRETMSVSDVEEVDS